MIITTDRGLRLISILLLDRHHDGDHVLDGWTAIP
jgi:hypothetical protein